MQLLALDLGLRAAAEVVAVADTGVNLGMAQARAYTGERTFTSGERRIKIISDRKTKFLLYARCISTRPGVREVDVGEVAVLLVRHQRGPQLGGRLCGGRAQPRGSGESAHARGSGEGAHARGGVAAPACAGEMVTILGVIVRTEFNQPSNKIPRIKYYRICAGAGAGEGPSICRDPPRILRAV